MIEKEKRKQRSMCDDDMCKCLRVSVRMNTCIVYIYVNPIRFILRLFIRRFDGGMYFAHTDL